MYRIITELLKSPMLLTALSNRSHLPGIAYFRSLFGDALSVGSSVKLSVKFQNITDVALQIVAYAVYSLKTYAFGFSRTQD